jgi:cytochrome oxidase Cu insertion factor (SCO1/SenC/PrrC family)
MPGMNNHLSADNPTVVRAFHAALLHDGLVVLALLALLAVVWGMIRASALRAAALRGTPGSPGTAGGARGLPAPPVPAGGPEPQARRLLRIGFALLWILDGLLQAQASMPLGLVPDSIEPGARSSPAWVQHVVAVTATIWTYHPITAATATVFVQLGLGLWLLLAPRGWWSRSAGAASVAWGLVVWVFGESFGGVFGHGGSFLFGLPGAVVFYCLAGVLVAGPERWFATGRLGRALLRAMGAFFVGMALLEAWPGRGFWRSGSGNSIAAMARAMSRTPQPRPFSSLLASFAAVAAHHPVALNGTVVALLLLVGLGLLVARPAAARAAIAGAAVLCLPAWLLVQDLGVLGGVGTDPNSMLPILLVLAGGYVAMTRPPFAPAEAVAADGAREAAAPARVLEWLRALARSRPSYLMRATAAAAALVVVALGGIPIAVASFDPHAAAIVSEAVDGAPNQVDFPAPRLRLVDQFGRTVTLAGLRPRAVVLAFLDPVCTVDCPIIAQEMRQADSLLGRNAPRVELVAVVANPLYRSLADVRAFDRVEHMAQLANWRFLTGSARQLRSAWDHFGVQVAVVAAGSMVAHADLVYVIDPAGRVRFVLDSNPGPATGASTSSFAGVLASSVERALASR